MLQYVNIIFVRQWFFTKYRLPFFLTLLLFLDLFSFSFFFFFLLTTTDLLNSNYVSGLLLSKALLLVRILLSLRQWLFFFPFSLTRSFFCAPSHSSFHRVHRHAHTFENELVDPNDRSTISSSLLVDVQFATLGDLSV